MRKRDLSFDTKIPFLTKLNLEIIKPLMISHYLVFGEGKKVSSPMYT